MGDLTLRAVLLVAAGGAAGALARWGVASALSRGFPVGTAVVNVLGGFLVGLVVLGGYPRAPLPADARLLLGVGFLGAFTTMSAFAHDTLVLLDERRWAAAALNFVVNPVLALVAAAAGRAAAVAAA